MNRIVRQPFKPVAVIMLGVFLALFTAASAWAEITTLSSAINKAGRQRMLTQRIVKAYCLVGMEVQSGTHKKQLDGAIQLFETQLSELKVFAPTAEIADGLAQVEELWIPFKEIAMSPPNKKGADRLLEINDGVLAAAHKVVLMLADHSATQVGNLVNISGRQRMLSQRLAKFYMARAWGIERTEIQPEMKKAADEFEAALMGELVNSDQNTPALQAVAVNTSQGTAILGSDCAHVFRNYREDWPSTLICDLIAWMKTYDRLRQRASRLELLFPGHDPLMTENYPESAPDVTRLA